MKDKSASPGAGTARRRLEWRPANALAVGAACRTAWSKGGGKRGKNLRGRRARTQP